MDVSLRAATTGLKEKLGLTNKSELKEPLRGGYADHMGSVHSFMENQKVCV
jgi:hypothetical protein